MGSISRVKVIYTDLEEFLKGLDRDIPVYGTLLDGENIYSSQLSSNGIIVMGNEGNGISPAIRELVNHRLLIPSYPPERDTAESLNVAIATAITVAEFRRISKA
jgi:TrmH family RNA methyltransferase